MRHLRSLRFAVLWVGLVAASCASDDDRCAAAAEHVEECFGVLSAASSCDPAEADQILSLSCEELAAQASGEKADVWSDLLCGFVGGDACRWLLYVDVQGPDGKPFPTVVGMVNTTTGVEVAEFTYDPATARFFVPFPSAYMVWVSGASGNAECGIVQGKASEVTIARVEVGLDAAGSAASCRLRDVQTRP